MIKVGILGGTGYTGGQLISLLINHPRVEIEWITSEKFKRKLITESFPQLKNILDIKCVSISQIKDLEEVDLVFSCLPNGTSQHFVKGFYSNGTKVIDLSSDFRVGDLDFYRNVLGFKHKLPQALNEAIYGLPEVFRNEIVNAKLVANPGCYATGVLLAIIPILKQKLVAFENIVVDIKSPISGIGRAPRLENHFSEVNQNVYLDHSVNFQKFEIEQKIKEFSKSRFGIVFLTHIVPVKRGIVATNYIKLKRKISFDKIYDLYKKFYSKESFVRLKEQGERIDLKSIVGSNYCDIGFNFQDDYLMVVSAIDNLIKGASGQAIQNMNIIFGFKEDEGINIVSYFP